MRAGFPPFLCFFASSALLRQLLTRLPPLPLGACGWPSSEQWSSQGLSDPLVGGVRATAVREPSRWITTSTGTRSLHTQALGDFRGT